MDSWMEPRMPGTPPPTDSACLESYLSGDKEGAQTLINRYERSLLLYFLRRLRRRDLAEEGLQETFTRLLERAKDLVSHPRVEAWLFAVARNVSVDVLRRRKSRAASFSELSLTGVEPGLQGPDRQSPDRRLESRELSAVVREVMRQMPAPEREVFLLRTEAMLPFREIAKRVDAPLNTVLSRMHRAMKRVRRAVVDEGWAEGRSPGRLG